MSTSDKLEVKVDWHETGRYTLKEGKNGRYADCVEMDLFGNMDKGSFFRAVAKRLSDHASNGVAFEYIDCTYDH